MSIGPEDLVAIGLKYVSSLVLCCVISITLMLMFSWPKYISVKLENIPSVVKKSIFATPLITWLIYLGLTFDKTITLVLLDSEDSVTAEQVYHSKFKTEFRTLADACALVGSRRQPPNVRFYAACLIADILSTNNDAEIVTSLTMLDAAPQIDTQFFGGNSLTARFYIPGHDQVHLPVRAIVEGRLRESSRLELIRVMH